MVLRVLWRLEVWILMCGGFGNVKPGAVGATVAAPSTGILNVSVASTAFTAPDEVPESIVMICGSGAIAESSSGVVR